MRWVRITLTTALLAFVAISLGKAVLAAVTPLPTAAEAAREPEASAPVVAYYFHATKRCVTCRAIE